METDFNPHMHGTQVWILPSPIYDDTTLRCINVVLLVVLRGSPPRTAARGDKNPSQILWGQCQEKGPNRVKTTLKAAFLRSSKNS